MKKSLYLAYVMFFLLFACVNKKEENKRIFLEGSKAFASGNYDKAIEYFTQCISNDDNMSDAYYNRATTYLMLKNYASAIQDYTTCLKIKPTNNLALFQRGIAYKNSNNHSEAIQDFTSAVNNDPAFKDAFFNRAWTYLSIGDTISACADFSTSKDLGYTDAEKFLLEFCTNK